MAQILVRNLDQRVVRRLKKRAKAAGRSLQAEAKAILEDAAKLDMDAARKALERFSRQFKGRTFSDSTELIREDRDR
jgi:plasmid stability protein